MSHKFGFPAMTNRALGNKPNTPSSPSKGGKILVRIIDIILDENHPNFNSNAGLNQIGQITAETVSINSSVRPRIYTATPAFPDKKNLPLINEYVYVYQIVSPNSIGGSWVYDPQPISLYGILSPNANPYPSSISDLNPSSQKLDYTQVELGASNITDNQLVELDLNSKTNPSQNTFVEKGNIHPLMPFAGDIIYEGRWGNSIRLGSTAKSKSKYVNNWSIAGENGDPITILRNGQNPNSGDFGAEPITENISKDLSSIYLTSTQKIPFSLANENFISYTKPPITPASFTSPQIILNSDRVILNAKTDNVLISGQKSIGLSSNESINLESDKVYIGSNDIRLGDKNATQPVLKGDDTVTLLKQVINELLNISTALKTIQIFPGGAPSPDPIIGPTANIAATNLNTILQQIDKIKSNFVKTS